MKALTISHSQLEAARSDPVAFAQAPRRGFGGGPSRFRYVTLAVRKYHAEGHASATLYLNEGFARRAFKNPNLPTYVGYLETYVREFRGRGLEAFSIGSRLSLQILEQVWLTGELGRVDLRADGYDVLLFTEFPNASWRTELRMPLIQMYHAKELGAPLDEVQVGIFVFATGKYETHCFSSTEVSRAFREAKRFGTAYASALAAAAEDL